MEAQLIQILLEKLLQRIQLLLLFLLKIIIVIVVWYQVLVALLQPLMLQH